MTQFLAATKAAAAIAAALLSSNLPGSYRADRTHSGTQHSDAPQRRRPPAKGTRRPTRAPAQARCNRDSPVRRDSLNPD
jgi:hypothetical protein